MKPKTGVTLFRQNEVNSGRCKLGGIRTRTVSSPDSDGLVRSVNTNARTAETNLAHGREKIRKNVLHSLSLALHLRGVDDDSYPGRGQGWKKPPGSVKKPRFGGFRD